MHWNQNVVEYSINSTMTPQTPTFEQVEQAIQASFQAWHAAQTSDLYFTYLGPTQARKSVTDRNNVLFWSDDSYELALFGAGGNFNAATDVTAYDETGEILDVDVVFNSFEWYDYKTDEWLRRSWTIGSLYFPRVLDVQSYATHEIGHLIGAAHNPLDQWGNPIVQGCPTMLIGSSITQTRCGSVWEAPALQMRTLEQADVDVANNLFSIRLTDLGNYASSSKSFSIVATANNNQRKMYRNSDGKLHKVFESGNQIFYRNSTDNGTIWSNAVRISATTGVSNAPSIAGTGNSICVVWQKANGSSWDVLYNYSTDAGTTWLGNGATLVSASATPAPGPLPTVSVYANGVGFLAFRAENMISSFTSSNGGASWASIPDVPGTTGTCNMPSVAINTTYWSTKQANVAYASDIAGGSPSIICNYYDFQTSSWGSSANLCSIVPSQYSHHANPSLAVSADESYKTIHVVWDADDTSPGNRVIIHRKGGFRSFPSVYSVLAYQGTAKPSIAGVTQEKAWTVYQNASGNTVWKRYYDGSYWNTGTWVANGFNPQISVGSTSARFMWSSGNSSPYQINVSDETLSKTGEDFAYSRTLNAIDTVSKSFVTLEVAPGRLVTKAKQILSLGLSEVAADSMGLGLSELERAGSSVEFALPSDADTLFLPVAVYGIGADKLFSQGGSVGVTVVNANTGAVLIRTFRVFASSVGTNAPVLSELQIPVAQVALASTGASLRVKPEFIGVRTDIAPVMSIGHIYKQLSGLIGAKPGSGEPRSSMVEKQASFDVHQNYPNPFNPSTTLEYQLPEDARVSLRVYDQLGREVQELVVGLQQAGAYEVKWNGAGVSSGMYYARFVLTDVFGTMRFTKVIKLLLAK